jgi:hypothetical protein
MNPNFPILALAFVLALPVAALAAESDAAAWTVYITNDNCPDYTWGLTEEQTRQAFADIVRGHLDEMNRTDTQPSENRDRYNMAVAQEALCFVEKYPERKDELVRRIKEGSIFVSPYLCNSLWGFASTEQTIRTLYPARRLEREWGIPKIEWAEHIEEPSLPWGTATILAGCGIRWLSNPFYNYDSTFSQLKNPPLFIHEGPDGSLLRVVMDPWASNKASYTQGARVLKNPQALLTEWLPHYRSLGAAYPLKVILASGTHGDISPGSGGAARGFAEAIANYNAAPGADARGAEPAAGAAGQPGTGAAGQSGLKYPAAPAAGSPPRSSTRDPRPSLVNAMLPMFCGAVDEAQARAPFLPTVRGCFGHSWDAWPVSLAKYAADMREGERQFLAAEALLAVVGRTRPELLEATRADRRRAEWCWAMLSDHAWNGTNERNQRHNADLRRRWAEEIHAASGRLLERASAPADIVSTASHVSAFNSLSVPQTGLVRTAVPAADFKSAWDREKSIDFQVIEEGGRCMLCFAARDVPGFGVRVIGLGDEPQPGRPGDLRATSTELEGPFYRLTVDPQTGGLASLVHKASGADLIAPGRRTLGQTVYFGAAEHTPQGGRSEVVAAGPVLARLKTSGSAGPVRVTTFITLYADLDRVDVEVRIEKPVTTAQERLCQVFPVMREGAVVRVETPGAVIRPRPQPEGDLLPGADVRRLAVQGFVDVSMPDGPGVTLVPLDAFLLRLDQEPLTFEALGNDQNYKEVCKDQNGVTEFRFRYVLCGHGGPYEQARAVAWSRAAAAGLTVAEGFSALGGVAPPAGIDPARAVALCLKPADDPAEGGVILRLWETAGKAGPLAVKVSGYKRVIQTDLLERDLRELSVEDGAVNVDLRPHGLAAVRLLP